MSSINDEIEKAKIEPETKVVLRSAFAEFENTATEWKEKVFALVVTDENQTDKIEEARAARLHLQKVRTGAKKIHDDLKESSLAYGRLVDKCFNIIKDTVEPMETHLAEQEKFVEMQATKRRQDLQAKRIEALKPYRIPGDGLEAINFGEMHDGVFENFLMGQRVAKETREANEIEQKRVREENERSAKEEREKIEAENERLMVENEKRRKEEVKRTARINRILPLGFTWNKEAAQYEKDDLVIAMGNIDCDSDEEFSQGMEIVEKEVGRRQKISDAAKVKRDAELKRLKEKEKKEADEKEARDARERKLKRAPDKEKLIVLREQISLLPLPELKDDGAKAILSNVQILLSKVQTFITEKTEQL